MKRFKVKWVLLVATCVLLTATLVYAQPGKIGVYGDPAGATCEIYDYPGADVLVYVMHTYSPGATGARFKLYWAGGANMTYLGERVTEPYFGKGTAFSGISIDYGGCFTSPNPIMTLHFMGNGDSPACSFLVVIPHPGASSVQIIDCSDPPNLLDAGSDCLVINGDERCPCYIPGWNLCPDIVPVQESTWGHIKMLYQQLN